MADPRSFVLIILGAVALLGVAWKLVVAWRTRRGVARLLESDVTPEEVVEAWQFQRAGLMELFRIMGDQDSLLTPAHRAAAARAISRLWAGDQLVAEEEQAFVRRGYAVTWKARRKYPRSLQGPLPIEVDFGVPSLEDVGVGVQPHNLEWSHRVVGARRASLEDWSSWAPGKGHARFEILPGDFEGTGPHRLVLEARMRTVDLTSRWEIDLPKIPFSIEFDPRLEVSSLLASPDAMHGRAMAAGVGLQTVADDEGGSPEYLALNQGLAIRNPPRLVVRLPLPRDLAHRMHLEVEGVEGHFPVGRLVLCCQGTGRADDASQPLPPRFIPIGMIGEADLPVIDRPGMYRARVILEADEALGWSDPEIRSVWPGTLETDWVTLEIIRR